MIPAGELRDRVNLQRPIRTADGQGGYTRTWQTIAYNVPADVAAPSGREILHAGQLGYDVDYSVRLRHRRTFDPTKRVVWLDGPLQRILDVQAATNPDGMRIELRLACVERAPVEGGG